MSARGRKLTKNSVALRSAIMGAGIYVPGESAINRIAGADLRFVAVQNSDDGTTVIGCLHELEHESRAQFRVALVRRLLLIACAPTPTQGRQQLTLAERGKCARLAFALGTNDVRRCIAHWSKSVGERTSFVTKHVRSRTPRSVH